MEKFSLFDFMSFVLPGGTFLILGYLLFSGLTISWFPAKIPDVEVIVIPFLLISYLSGHLLNLLGKKLEKWIPKMKFPWTHYLDKYPTEVSDINKNCISLFKISLLKDDAKTIDINKSDNAYNKIYDYIEVLEKDKKIKILISQYAFFRNSIAVWFLLLLILILLLVVKLFNAALLKFSIWILACYSIIVLLFLVASVILLKQRKIKMMDFVYRTFLAINVQPHIN